MRGCFFSEDSKFIYTLATQIRSKSYLIKWKNAENFDPENVVQVHSTMTGGMRIAPNGKKVGIMTSEGCVKLLDLSSERIELD